MRLLSLLSPILHCLGVFGHFFSSASNTKSGQFPVENAILWHYSASQLIANSTEKQ